MLSSWQAASAQPISNISTILCYYINSTRKMQLIRVASSQNLSLEKIVFPQQRILFEAIAEGQLEIYTSQAGKQKIAQVIPCQSLQVNQLQQPETVLEHIAV